MEKERKSSRSGGKGASGGRPFKSEGQAGQRELVVIAKTEAGLRATKEGVASAAGTDVSALSKLLESEGASMQPLCGLSEERMRERTRSLAAESGQDVPDMSVFYHVEAPDERLDGLAESLRALEVVENAYVKGPSCEPVVATEEVEVLNDMAPATEEPPITTPDFANRQGYLGPAPGGIDAHYAWSVAGGRGAGVKIVDCEWGWRFTHEDLLENQMGVIIGNSSSNDNHGTAVLGEISGDRNAFGILGICPDAIVGAARFGNTAQIIRQAADKLSAGDIILLEIHRAGPNATGAGQFGYIAVEWWPDDFSAIRYAVSKGIIVVEAAGNGSQNLDDAIYNTRPTGFPSWWRNPFNTDNPSSGAVLVGAGAPPPGTHGRNHGPDRSRLGFSNYGARVDCQGWGREVTSTGYGDLQGGSNKDEWYTDQFSGTSSASPIVVGALGCIQGALRAQGGPLLTPARAISLVRKYGSPQQDAPGRPKTQHIGNRPDLRQMIPAVTSAWLYNKTVVRTHAKNGSQMAWAYLQGSGWRRVNPRSSDGVSNVFQILCAGLANSRKVDVYIRNGQIEQATLR
ncbi:MAG: S8 family serine peptidase [Planctomycetota bacterium]|nr:MAG: S8 family serine peptidase [Planctomycetota bacterium]